MGRLHGPCRPAQAGASPNRRSRKRKRWISGSPPAATGPCRSPAPRKSRDCRKPATGKARCPQGSRDAARRHGQHQPAPLQRGDTARSAVSDRAKAAIEARPAQAPPPVLKGPRQRRCRKRPFHPQSPMRRSRRQSGPSASSPLGAETPGQTGITHGPSGTQNVPDCRSSSSKRNAPAKSAKVDRPLDPPDPVTGHGLSPPAIGRHALIGDPHVFRHRCRSARKRRSGCRRADTSSRRS